MRSPIPVGWLVAGALAVAGVVGGIYAVSTVYGFFTESGPRATDVASERLVGEWNHYETPTLHSRLTLEIDGSFTIDSIPAEVFGGNVWLADDSRETRWANAARSVSGSWGRLDNGDIQLFSEEMGIATVFINQDGSDITLSAPLRTAYDEWGSSCFTYSPSGDHLHGSCG